MKFGIWKLYEKLWNHFSFRSDKFNDHFTWRSSCVLMHDVYACALSITLDFHVTRIRRDTDQATNFVEGKNAP